MVLWAPLHCDITIHEDSLVHRTKILLVSSADPISLFARWLHLNVENARTSSACKLEYSVGGPRNSMKIAFAIKQLHEPGRVRWTDCSFTIATTTAHWAQQSVPLIENSWLQVAKFVIIHESYEIFKTRQNSLNYSQVSQSVLTIIVSHCCWV